MKKEDLIYILHKKHALNIEELKKYDLITGILDNNMMKKTQKICITRKIPKILKNKVQDTFIGQEYGICKCYCCNNSIDSKKFEAGHIIASSKNGSICRCCNKSIGVMNLSFQLIY